MKDCLFCQIIEGKIPSKKVYEDEQFLAFWDINPVAPVHILIVPKKHIESVHHLKDEEARWIGQIFLVAQKVATQMKVDKTGYRLIFNCGPDSGMVIEHLHMHLLGGKHLGHKLVE